MSWKNTASRYGSLAIGLHWLMLLLIGAVYATIELRGMFPKGSDPREAMKMWHFMLGLSVLLLTLLRIANRFSAPTPAIEPPLKPLQDKIAKLMHLALYGLMLGMPLVGWLILSAAGKPIPFFGLELPALIGANKSLADQLKEVHEAAGSFGYVLIGAHAAAALFHHHVQHDNTLLRMLPARR